MTVEFSRAMLFSMQRYNFFESDSQLAGGCVDYNELFSMQRYNFFESDSQHRKCFLTTCQSCLACKDTIFLKAIHNVGDDNPLLLLLFSMQRYNFFESDSQHSIN